MNGFGKELLGRPVTFSKRYTGDAGVYMLMRILVCLASLTSLSALAAPVQPIANNVVADKFRSLSFDNQRLAGLLSDRLRANIEGFLERVDFHHLTAPEAAGKFLLAAANTYEYRQDAKLRTLMDQVAGALAQAQQPDGYLGPGQRDTKASYRALGSALLGLLAYYRVTGEEGAYTSAQKIGDLLVKTLHTGSNGEELRSASAALAGPLVVLYRYTAETGYLDLAKSLVASKNVLTTVDQAGSAVEPSDYADVFAALAGLADLYRVTGDRTYLQTAVRAWEQYARSATNLTGVPGSIQRENVNNCAATEWLNLTLELFRITGEWRFGEQLEKTIYNQLLAGQDGRTGDLCADTPLNGKKRFIASRLESGVSACTLSEAEGLSLIPQAIWARWANGIAINLYTAGRGTFQLRRRALVQVFSEALYPERGDILLHIEPSRTVRFPLRLRVPEWADSFAADFGGSHLLGKPGEFMLIEREWKRGDTVKITIGMRVQILHEKPPGSGRIALQRGPQVLALGRILNPEIKDLALVSPVLADDSHINLNALESKLPTNWSGNQVYQVMAQYDGRNRAVTLVPYADAIDFTIWLSQPAMRSSLSR